MQILGLISGVVILINHYLMCEGVISFKGYRYNIVNAITCLVFTVQCFLQSLWGVALVDLAFVLIACNNILKRISNDI